MNKTQENKLLSILAQSIRMGHTARANEIRNILRQKRAARTVVTKALPRAK